MKTRFYKLFFVLLIVVIQSNLSFLNAQIIPPYSINFEDEARFNSEWDTEDDYIQMWMIGSEVANGGSQSIYVSFGGGDYEYSSYSAPYSHFYQTVQVPQGGMTIEFDYTVGGIANEDILMVGLFPAGTVPDHFNGVYGNYLREYCCQSEGWQHDVINIPASEAGNKVLVFTWKNTSGEEVQPPAAIDNLSITAVSCLIPTGLVYSNPTIDGATISWDNPNTSEDVTIAYKTSASSDWTEIDYTGTSYVFNDLLANTSYDVKVKSICSSSENSEYTLPVTFSTLATCQIPSNLVASVISDESVTLNWQQGSDGNNNFAVSYAVLNSNIWTDESATGTEHTINELTPGTSYEVKLKSVCGPSSESSNITLEFTTTCLQYVQSLPFEEDFEGNVFPPQCWKYQKISGDTERIQWMRSTDEANSGDASAMFNSYSLDESHSAVLVTPKLDLSAERKKLIFSVYRYDGMQPDEGVNVLLNNNSDITDAEELVFIPRVIWMEPEVYDDGWYDYAVDLTDVEYQNGYILFQGISEYGDDIYIDDVKVIEPTLYNRSLDEYICEGGQYDFYGTIYSEAGQYTHIIITNHETDTLVTLNLTVRPIQRTSFEASTCENVPYEWDGQEYTEAGEHERTFTDLYGCDSIVTLNLTVRPIQRTSFDISICEDASYDWYGELYTETGEFERTFTDINGCDSISTLNLTVLLKQRTSFEASTCENVPYEWAGEEFTESGEYERTFTDINDCDSISTLILTVHPIQRTSFDAAICDGSAYEWAGEEYTEAGEYEKTFTDIYGCDSIVTLNLIERQPQSSSFDAYTCENVPYEWEGQQYTQAGEHERTFTDIYGCDSIVTLNLTVREIQSTSFSASTCENTPYEWEGQQYIQAGEYERTFTDIYGCDSIVTLNLIIRELQSSSFEASTCENVPYEWAGREYTQAGEHERTFTDIYGCDSTVTLNLTIKPIQRTSFEISICEGTSYDWAGQEYSTQGNHERTFDGVNGCDSIVTLILTVNDKPEAPVIAKFEEEGIIYLVADFDEGLKWYKNNVVIENETSLRCDVDGIGDYYATASNDCGESDPSNIIKIEDISVPDVNYSPISVYPNPASTEFTISNTEKVIDRINIVSVDGKIALQKDVNNYSITIDVNNFTEGIYILNCWIGENVHSYKIKIIK